MQLLQVTKVRYLDGYRLELHFNDESVKEVDLAGELYGEVFEPLREEAYFRQVAVNAETTTIEWPNGADLAPEDLHEIGHDVEQLA